MTLSQKTDFEILTTATLQPLTVAMPVGTNPIVPIVPRVTPLTPPVVIPNIAKVDASGDTDQGNTGALLAIAGVGIGALLLFTPQGKKALGSIGGKKKKGKGVLPLLLVGGAAAYYFYSQSQTDSATPPETPPVTPPSTAGQVPVTAEPPPIVAPVEVATVARGYTAATDAVALSRDWPATITVVGNMTDSEVIAMYNYFYGYVLPGKVLHQNPPVTGSWADGGWDTQLYNAIAAIRSKYSVNI